MLNTNPPLKRQTRGNNASFWVISEFEIETKLLKPLRLSFEYRMGVNFGMTGVGKGI